MGKIACSISYLEVVYCRMKQKLRYKIHSDVKQKLLYLKEAKLA